MSMLKSFFKQKKKTSAIFVSFIMLVNTLTANVLPSTAYADQGAGPVPVYSFGSGNTGNIRVVEFDATPSIDNIDAVIGITSSSAVPTAAADFPVAIRLNAAGSFDAGNSGSFAASQTVTYTAGSKYHIKTLINLPGKTYDVWVTPPGGAPTLAAKDFSFVAGAQAMNDIGNVYIATNSGGACSLENVRIIQNSFASKTSFASNSYSIESDNFSGRPYVIKFDYTAANDLVDSLVSYVDSSTNVTAFANLAYIFHTEVASGLFDARNDSVYANTGTIKTAAGVTFHVKLVLDLNTKLYDVWVAPEGGTPVQIASAYKVRNYATTNLNNINKLIVYSAADGQVAVNNHLVLDGAQLTAAIASVNNAAAVADMKAALTSNSLGLALDKYSTMPETSKDMVAQDMLSGKPYADDMAIQKAFENSVTVRRDSQPPTAPGNVAVEITNSLQAKIVWTPSTDDAGIKYYKVFRNGNELATVSSGTNYVDGGLQPATTYSYVVKAYDTVLHETASVPVSVTTPAAGQVTYFPFTPSVINNAFNQSLLKYALTDSSVTNPSTGLKYKYVIDWSYMNSSTALKYLTVASYYNPDYIGPDGSTTVSQQALAQIRSVIGGGSEPGCAGNGLSSQGYLPVLEAFTVAKLKIPSIWNQLTADEKYRIDLIMQAALIGSHFCYSDLNDNKTGIDQTGNFDKTWNPNMRAGVMVGVLASYYFGADNANSILKNFSYDSFMAQLTGAGLTNIATVFSNTGKTQLEQYTTNDGANGYTYMGHTLSQPGLWVKELNDYSFSLPVSPVGGGIVPVSPTYPYGYQGFLVNGFDDFPNLGASSMGLEFDSNDAGGKRSSENYVYMGWKSLIEGLYAVELLGGDTGLTAGDMTAMMNKLDVGTTDMLYKDANGYNTYDKGTNNGVVQTSASWEASAFFMNKDLWINVINNPITSVQYVNTATDATAMKTLIESDGLNLVLYGYNALGQSGKNAVVQAVLSGRPAGGYANKAAIQDAVYNAVKIQAVSALNSAATVDEFITALKSNALGIYIPKYDGLTVTNQKAVAQILLDQKPAGGYTDKAAVRSAVNSAVDIVVAPVAGQLKNLPPVTGSNKRINYGEYDAELLNTGDAHVALWNDDKVGAYSITIDDNNDAEHNTWLDYSSQYGFKFTWFTITGASNPVFNPTEWTRMLAAGEDVGSHTVHHYTASQASSLTPQQLADEFALPVQTINALPGGNCKTLGYANGYVNEDLASQYYIAARGGVGYPNQADSVNYLQVNSLSMTSDMKTAYTVPNDVSIEASIKTLFDKNYQVWGKSYYQGWTNVHWHSINRDIIKGLNIDLKPLAVYMLNMLRQNMDKVWVGTFTEVAMYGQERDTANLKVTENNPDLIKFTLTDQMDDTLFNYPLTVKVRVDNSWSNILAKQNGVNVPVTVVTKDSKQYALVKAVPDRGEVILYPASMQAINNAVTVSDMKTAITSADLSLNLTAYNALLAEDQDVVAQKLISVRPVNGYTDRTAVQAALDSAVTAQNDYKLLLPVNSAFTINDMKAAITTASLGLSLTAYNGLPAASQEEVAQRLISGKPTKGYTSKTELQTTLDAAVQSKTILTNTITTSADTFISEVAPTTNYGNQNWLQTRASAGGRREIYERYDLSGLTSLTADAVNSVKVRIYPYMISGSLPVSIAVYGLNDNSWPEKTITWDNASAYPVDETPIQTIAITAINQYIDLDVTDYVKAKLATGEKTISLVFAGVAPGAQLLTYYGLTNANASKIVINWQAMTPVQAVNSADIVSTMKAAITSADLGLELTAYNALMAVSQDEVVQGIITNKPVNGYLDKASIQAALDTMVAVYSEKVPPVTTMEIDKTELNGWFNSNITITLTATDNLSGVKSTESRLSGSENWSTYTAPVVLTQDGTYTVQYCSIDRAGNMEDAKQQIIHIDKTAPLTSASASGTLLSNGTYNSDVALTLTAADSQPGAGVEKTEYSLDGTNWLLYGSPIVLTDDGIYTVSFRTYDMAGNTELNKSITININKAPDILALELIGKIKNMGIEQGIQNSLTSKLDNVIKSVLKDNKNSATNQLSAFINEVDAQNGKKLSLEQASEAKVLANTIISKIK